MLQDQHQALLIVHLDLVVVQFLLALYRVPGFFEFPGGHVHCDNELVVLDRLHDNVPVSDRLELVAAAYP